MCRVHVHVHVHQCSQVCFHSISLPVVALVEDAVGVCVVCGAGWTCNGAGKSAVNVFDRAT